jgi:PNKP adenylyltransferase domain, ligase domain
MPWSAKALELVRQQYASVGTAARIASGETAHELETAATRGIGVGALLRSQARPTSTRSRPSQHGTTAVPQAPGGPPSEDTGSAARSGSTNSLVARSDISVSSE